MALRDWLQGVATLATPATDRGDSGRSVATVATVARPANDPAPAPGLNNREVTATAAPANRELTSADGLRELVAIVAADWPADERADALAAALADPEAALTCYRALVAERETGTHAAAPAREELAMPSCRSCANLSPAGRCLAAWRGESLGAGIGTSRTYTPAMPDRPQRCGAYAPGPSDPDRRSGRERWPWLF